MKELTYAKRQEFLKTHRLDTARCPTLSFVSICQHGPMGVMAKHLHSKYGINSDGMVPELDAIIPGSHLIRRQGLDHAGTVMLLDSKDADQPADITQALIYMALQHATVHHNASAVTSAAAAGAQQGGEQHHHHHLPHIHLFGK